jgi:hypothetical protein
VHVYVICDESFTAFEPSICRSLSICNEQQPEYIKISRARGNDQARKAKHQSVTHHAMQGEKLAGPQIHPASSTIIGYFACQNRRHA